LYNTMLQGSIVLYNEGEYISRISGLSYPFNTPILVDG
jgi:hypothetical protein